MVVAYVVQLAQFIAELAQYFLIGVVVAALVRVVLHLVAISWK